MNLLPLNDSTAPQAFPISCCACNTRQIYYNARIQGWKFDAEGKPFNAYYCPNCQGEQNVEEAENSGPHSSGEG